MGLPALDVTGRSPRVARDGGSQNIPQQTPAQTHQEPRGDRATPYSKANRSWETFPQISYPRMPSWKTAEWNLRDQKLTLKSLN